jgi:hypothetical protein
MSRAKSLANVFEAVDAILDGKRKVVLRESDSDSRIVANFYGDVSDFEKNRVIHFQNFLFRRFGLPTELTAMEAACVRVFLEYPFELRARADTLRDWFQTPEAQAFALDLGLASIQARGKLKSFERRTFKIERTATPI